MKNTIVIVHQLPLRSQDGWSHNVRSPFVKFRCVSDRPGKIVGPIAPQTDLPNWAQDFPPQGVGI
ncbi:hypothetical protein [Actibacterium lipolyticum]|uniref:hypothetical protein n=1 Tax=Actibacterium lipolyticum TaxID=1524263 RepID=UPI000BB45635|nr:hypothetical protein [Actibacterium lipolyticum]